MHTVVKPTRTPRAKRESPSQALAKVTGSRPIAADPVERIDPNDPHWECQCGERNALDGKTCRRCARVRQTEAGVGQIECETCGVINAAERATCTGCAAIIPGGNNPDGPVEPLDDVGEASERAADVYAQIPIGQIAPSPTNPRKTFGIDGLNKLAESIKTAGLIQPLVVRTRFAGSYELVAGERRYRAALIAGLEKVPCIVREIPDAEVIEIQLLENLDREDLNPIEEAETFRQLTTTGGYTQERLAQRLHCGQSHIAHRIRLLELPEAWRAAVMSQDIPVTHARVLLPWVKFPAVLKEVNHWLKPAEEDEDDLPTVQGFEREVVRALHDCSRDMDPKAWHGPKFEVTAEVEAKLQIVDVPCQWGKGTERRAFATKLWDKLQSAAKSKQQAADKAAAEARRTGKPKAGAAKGGKTAKKHEPTDLQFGRMVWAWRTRWLCGRLQELCDKKELEPIIRLIVLLKDFGRRNSDSIGKLCGVKQYSPRPKDVCGPFAKAGRGAGFGELLGAYASAELAQGKKTDYARDPFMNSEDLPHVAGSLGVGLEGWQPTADYLALYSDRRLRALVKTPAIAKTFKAAGAKEFDREAWTAALIATWPRGHVPAELATCDHRGYFKGAAVKR